MDLRRREAGWLLTKKKKNHTKTKRADGNEAASR
jgi:hypothetical protein